MFLYVEVEINESMNADVIVKHLKTPIAESTFEELWSFLSKIIVFKLDGENVDLPVPGFKHNPFLFPTKKVHEFQQFKNLTVTVHSLNYVYTLENKYKIFKSSLPDVVIFYDVDQELEREITRMDEVFPMAVSDSMVIPTPKMLYNVFIKNSIQSQLIYDKVFFESRNFETFI